MKFIITLMLVASSLVPTASVAQPVRSISEMLNTMNAIDAEISKSHGNLLQMQAGSSLPDSEASGAALVSEFAGYLQAKNETLIMVTTLYTLMTTESDRKTTLKFVRLALTGTIKSAERLIETTNRVLPRFTSSAVISEVQRLRDNAQRLNDKLQMWKP